jgi:radical SAM protein with 4Fe4S-binding SPASM domain
MGAKKGTRWTGDRTPLQEVIPLETPYLLFVDPSSVCNFRCKFCPCGGANKEFWSPEKRVSIMPYELYRKIIDDLTEFPGKLKTLRLYKEGEPLVNKRLPDMIHYARKKGVTQKIDFTTNGSLFDCDTALAITDAGVDRINISVEALDEAGYEQISGVKLNYREYLERLRFLYHNKNGCHIFIKISDLGLKGHSEQEFYDMFADICDEIAVEHVSSVWPEFEVDENLKSTDQLDIYGGPMAKRDTAQVCPYLFYSLCVNSDGTVSACLMDWNHQLLIGDLKCQSLLEIWNGQRLREMRENHLMFQRSIYHTCRNCGQLEYAVLDNIDPYREVLLNKIRK